jgi:acyl-CoA thioesterase II
VTAPLRHDAGVIFQTLTLSDVIESLRVHQLEDDHFVADQLDSVNHHIVGGHIAAQSLMAASRTAQGRIPHSAHVYYLRAGDARRPVDFHVERARDGGTLSTRRVTARQEGEVLLEALASFTTPIDDAEHQVTMPDVPDPESLLPVQEQLADYAGEFGGHWVRPQPFEFRYADAPPRLAVERPTPSPRMRMWWRATESVPDDPVLHSCLLTYVSGTTMLETAIAMRGATPVTTFSALIDHALWFHRPIALNDWVLSDQLSPSGVHGRGLATATMYNRTGELVCSATQEVYFGGKRRTH